MADSNQTQIILGVLTLIGVLGGAAIANWDKFSSSPQKTISQSGSTSIEKNIEGDGNIHINGSNNIINQPEEVLPCRDISHGVERYARTFNVSRSSNWMGGGYSQDRWCNGVIASLRGEHPHGEFQVLGKSESKKNTCPPFNCPQYKYHCTVQIKAEPIYHERLSDACR